MGQRRNFWQAVTDMADLNSETPPGLPLVEVVGEGRVLIENHMGVNAYEDCQIRVKVKFGQIVVCGRSLTLCRMTKDQLLISGSIDSVTLCRRGT